MADRELLLLRHGIAEERDGIRPDAERALTAAGIQRTQQVVRRLQTFDLAADRLLSSPLRRARQTAEIAVAAGLAPSLALDAALAPGGDPLPLLQGGDWQRLLLVGHEPDLGELACRLIGAPAGAITLKKAGLALLDLGGEGVRLRLLLTPRLILAAAGATAGS